MKVLESSRFISFLEETGQASWNEMLDGLEPSIHPVDRDGTRIWFSFWPLELPLALAERGGPAEMARVMDLEGDYVLERQIDLSVDFLYGARYWSQVKKAVLAHAEEDRAGGSLEKEVRDVAVALGARLKVDPSLLLGITAVGFMILRQVGFERLAAVGNKPAARHPHAASPEDLVKRRTAEPRAGLKSFLRGAARRFTVTWDEKRVGATFPVVCDQDLATGAATDKREYRAMDYRRTEGPLPVECRIGSCGYWWVGVLSGKDHLTPLSDYERSRLRYFGYDTTNAAGMDRPNIRLACQARALGNVTVVVPLWNGELKRRFNRGIDGDSGLGPL
jgi:ferredoxin